MNRKNSFPIIGIGASAGGLEPLEVFFDHVNNVANYAYVVVQHLAPNHKSMMDELLARHTSLPIQIIEDDMEVKPRHIYLNPPKKFVEIQDNHFKLSDKEERKLSFPITTFFNSLAEDRHEQCVGVIVSGTGSDGSEGLKFIKEKGGLVLVQQPETAKFDGMPKSAINTTHIDKVMNVEDFPEEIDLFFKSYSKLEIQSLNAEENLNQLNQLLGQLREITGIDFRGYKHSTIYRRTLRRMGILGYHDVESYGNHLMSDNQEAIALCKELLIGVTRFFRDSDTFEIIEHKVIPELIHSAKNSKSLRIWIPACSTGEEAYSLALLIKDYLKNQNLQLDVTIFATDLDNEAIKKAGNRTFTEAAIQDIPEKLVQAYFIPQNNGYRVAKVIREMVVFSIHNLIKDPPFSKIDLISCRNFLIYLKKSEQKKVFKTFGYSLKQQGFLILGSSESLTEINSNFEEFDSKSKIYRNSGDRKAEFQATIGESWQRQKNAFNTGINTGFNKIHPQKYTQSIENIQEELVQHYVPDSVIYNKEYTLIHTVGKVTNWLKLPIGKVTNDIRSMIPEEWVLPLEVASNKALELNENSYVNDIIVPDSHRDYFNTELISIQIYPMIKRGGNSYLAASFFENKDNVTKQEYEVTENSIKIDFNSATQEKMDFLERELRVSKENLQSTLEELESSNEELQASNEELQSSNEELESVNEELHTVNTEFQEKVEELTYSNNDLNNLIQSTDIAILFLDSNLNIRRYTPAIKDILNLIPQDIGRHISNFRFLLNIDDLTEKVKQVHEKLTVHETIINDLKENNYMMRISPFRTMKNEIKGVVISFINITAFNKTKNDLKVSNEALNKLNSRFEKQNELFKILSNNATDLITLLDINSSIEYISPSCTEITEFNQEELLDKQYTDLIYRKDDKVSLEQIIKDLKENKNVGLFLFQSKTKTGKIIWLESRFKSICNEEGELIKILISATEVSKRIAHEEELRKLSLIAQQTTNSVIITDIHGKTTYVNKAFEKLTGHKQEEIIGKAPGALLQGKESDPDTIQEMRFAIKKVKNFNVDILNYTKKGHKYWTNIQCEPLYNRYNEHIGFFSLQYDITRQKEFERHIESLNDMLKQRSNKLSEVNKSLEEFAYTASHDLKEPIRNIIGMLDLIERKKNESESKEKTTKYFNIIRKAAGRANALIESLLEYSRTGTVSEELEEISIRKTFEEVKSNFTKLINENNAIITLHSELSMIKVYPILFNRLLQNLISNAIKYKSDQSPEIKIKATEDKNFTFFEVKDNGIGLEEEHKEDIFKLFSKSAKETDSNGIGLSVCKKIVELHQGEIKARNNKDKGSTFSFSINKHLQ